MGNVASLPAAATSFAPSARQDSPSGPPPPPAPTPPPPQDDAPKPKGGDGTEYGYGWEHKKYGGAFTSKATVKRQLSSAPDDMELWKLTARSERLLETFGEADEAIASRPKPHPPKHLPEDCDLNEAVGKACHRQCGELWKAYEGCKSKTKDHDKCLGWYET